MVSFNEHLNFDSGKIDTKVLIETSFSKEIRILLKQGQHMKEHKAPYPILIHVLEGSIDLGVQGTMHDMKTGSIIALESSIPHDLKAKENSIIRLSLSKQDKAERVEAVAKD